MSGQQDVHKRCCYRAVVIQPVVRACGNFRVADGRAEGLCLTRFKGAGKERVTRPKRVRLRWSAGKVTDEVVVALLGVGQARREQISRGWRVAWPL